MCLRWYRPLKLFMNNERIRIWSSQLTNKSWRSSPDGFFSFFVFIDINVSTECIVIRFVETLQCFQPCIFILSFGKIYLPVRFMEVFRFTQKINSCSTSHNCFYRSFVILFTKSFLKVRAKINLSSFNCLTNYSLTSSGAEDRQRGWFLTQNTEH